MVYAIYGHWPAGDEQFFGGDGDIEKMSAAIQRMRELAHEGTFCIWGRTSPNSLQVLIEPDFWVHYQIDLMSLWGAPEKAHTEPATHVNAREYQALMVNRTQMEAFWPPIAPKAPKYIPLQAAAQIAYEQAEREGWLEKVAPARGSDPQQRLDFFKYAMILQAQHYAVTLSGAQPPSTQPYPIPANRIAGLHPMKGENTLHRGSVAGQAEFRDVTISADDLDKVTAIYRALATGEADLSG